MFSAIFTKIELEIALSVRIRRIVFSRRLESFLSRKHLFTYFFWAVRGRDLAQNSILVLIEGKLHKLDWMMVTNFFTLKSMATELSNTGFQVQTGLSWVCG